MAPKGLKQGGHRLRCEHQRRASASRRGRKELIGVHQQMLALVADEKGRPRISCDVTAAVCTLGAVLDADLDEPSHFTVDEDREVEEDDAAELARSVERVRLSIAEFEAGLAEPADKAFAKLEAKYRRRAGKTPK